MIRSTMGGSDVQAWHKVKVNNGAKYSKEELLQALVNAVRQSNMELAPICYRKEGPHQVFYVENNEMAALMKRLNVVMSDGSSLTFHVTRSPPPHADPDADVIEKFKTAMANRYNVRSLFWMEP